MDAMQEEAAASSHFDANAQRSRGLARKITCSVVSIVATGAIIIAIIQVLLTLTAVHDWARVVRANMNQTEEANLEKLALAKAVFVSESFDRARESVLQLQGFAQQAVLEAPETMTVEAYLRLNSGLTEASSGNFNHSVWFVPGLTTNQLPEAGTSLEGLLNRSSLMDIAFRGMQRQHNLTYLAALDNPSAPMVSQINFQSYLGQNRSSYLGWAEGKPCDDRYLGDDFDGDSYEPRCRPWYQDAIADGNTGAIITDPYLDADNTALVMTATAPVYDPSGILVQGVVGLDIEADGIGNSIKNLTVIDGEGIGDEGYAYLLASGGEGQVALHRDLKDNQTDPVYIYDLEVVADKDLFRDIVENTMVKSCNGSARYTKNGGEQWLLSWRHEAGSRWRSSSSLPFTSSSSSSSDVATSCGADDFIVVVTVSEAVLLEAFSETETQILRVVFFATAVMALLLLAIGCTTGCVTQFMAGGIIQPVNQLIDVVHSLNKLDFSRQAAGTWMVNDTCSPEVEELMKAFKSMSTVVKFANTTLASGDIAAAKAIYVEALTLFTKLGNSRGVGIVNNNLGNVHAMQAAELVTQAARESDPARVKELVETAQWTYADAATNYRLAIDDAEMFCAASNQHDGGPSPATTIYDGVDGTNFEYDVEDYGAPLTEVDMNDEGDTSVAALYRQLANRKSNLALCLAAKGNSAVVMGGRPDPNAIEDARTLLRQCIQLTSSPASFGRGREGNANVAKNNERRFGYLLQLSVLEREQQGRSREAGKALEEAERVIAPYASHDPDGWPAARVTPLETPVMILRQRLLEARAAHWVIGGYPEAAIDDYTEAITETGDVMDPAIVRSSLLGLRGLVSNDINLGLAFSSDMLVALGLPLGAGQDPELLIAAIDDGLDRVVKEETSMVTMVAGKPRNAGEKTTVDLCFVMDCTGSMQSWIDQAKNKLLDIIAQAKKDVTTISLRVAFVGYRDFGDKVQYEGPIDFHKEDELPKLLAKLKKIKAYGGQDIPEDVAGGLHLATGLDWRGDIRLCILIADAPCHGSAYHRWIADNYPKGCPKGRDPCKLLYTLQHEIGADFYFVRITQYTDKMISVFQNAMSSMWAQKQGGGVNKVRQAPAEKRRDIVVHDLGSDDNRFLEVVVESVKMSVKQQFKFESY